MSVIIHRVLSFSTLLVYLGAVKCYVERYSINGVGENVNLRAPILLRNARNSEDTSLVWEDYEFDTGTGNREELIVTNISAQEDPNLPASGKNRQFLQVNGNGYLAETTDRTLSLYELNEHSGLTENRVDLPTDGQVLTFKLVDLASIESRPSVTTSGVAAILSVDTTRDISLRWYVLTAGNFTEFWRWPVEKRVERLEIVRHEGEHKLLLLENPAGYRVGNFVPIEIYGFSLDFASSRYEFWLFQRPYVPKTFNIVACPVYESTVLAVQTDNRIFLYDFVDNSTRGPFFLHFQNISSHNLNNFICFQSGYIQYLGISGPEAGLYKFIDAEFSFDMSTEKFFDEYADIVWIKDIQVDTYRDEALLLVQLKNSSVVALTWQGTGYTTTILPNQILDNFDLSKVTVISKFGFLSGNVFVRIETKLRDLRRPIHDKMQNMVQTKILLQEVLKKQEDIVKESDSRMNESYGLKSPVVGYWNLSKVEAENVTITDNVTFRAIFVNSKEMFAEDLKTDVDACKKKLEIYEEKLAEIKENLSKSFLSNATTIDPSLDWEVSGSLRIEGVLNVKNLTFDSLNGMPMSDIRSDYADHGNATALGGRKIFPAVHAENITYLSLNGVPFADILFDPDEKDYSKVDFAKIKRLVVDEHLTVSVLNDVNWDNLLKDIVWKNESAIIPGDVVIDGEIVADLVELDFVNNVKYPQNYVLVNDPNFVTITGEKTFESLQITNRFGIETINDIPIDDYVVLDRDEVLDQEITFHDLRIDGNWQIDGNITGKQFKYVGTKKMLNESNTISSDVIFSNLTIRGEVFLEDSINGITWSDFKDFVQRTDKVTKITGRKAFLGDVEMGSPINITTGKINGHHMEEFVTLDTEQEFQNLERILANVTFEKITDLSIKNLENYLKANTSGDVTDQCSNRKLVFEVPPIVDELTFNVLNNNISQNYFNQKLNETFSEAHFENLTVTTLLAGEIVSNALNGIDLADFEKRRITSSTTQTLTGSLTIGFLTADSMETEFLNDMPMKPLRQLKDEFGSIRAGIFGGFFPLQNLTVTRRIEARYINGKPVGEVYAPERIGTVAFEKDVFIRNLTVTGLINNRNFSEFVADAILKTDTDIVVNGHKTFDTINCRELELSTLNGHSLKDIVDPSKNQFFQGPVNVEGFVTVEDNLDVDGKISQIPFSDLRSRFQAVGNDSYELRGDFYFANDAHIKNLEVNGTIQNTNFDSFSKSLIFKYQRNVSLLGTTTFEDPVNFGGSLIISDKLNDINLRQFYENAIFIDKPFSVKAELAFRDGLRIEKDLIVNSEFETNTIAGVDLNDLQANAMYTNRPTYVTVPMTFENAVFKSTIEVETWNGVNTGLVIPLKTDQAIDIDVFRCRNVFVNRSDIHGTINNYKLDAIYNDSFLLTGNQHITGNITFHGYVKARHNFNAKTLNGIDPKQIISINDNETLTGHFVFEEPIIQNGSLRLIDGYLNGIDLVRWEALAVMSNSQMKQSVSANWIVHGDVRFNKNVSGNGFLDGVSVEELSDILKQRNAEIEYNLGYTKMDQENMCSDLNNLKPFAQSQIYRFNTFEYLQILDFDRIVTGVHHFESNGLDYLLVGYNTCHMDVFIYTGTVFKLVANVSKFGHVEKWITLMYNNEPYFLTLGKQTCGRNAGNLWKIESDQFKHVAGFGNVTDARKINDYTFLILIDQKIEKRSIPQLYGRSVGDFQFCPVHRDNMKFVENSDRILVSSYDRLYEYDKENLNHTSWENQFGSSEIVSCRAGLYNKEILLYHGQNVSTDYIFVCNNDISQKKILQAIKTHNPKHFVVLNFENSVETLLVFAENDRHLQIYEYKGIHGFVHRNNIQLQVDKLYNFKIRKYTNLAKRHCIAAIHNNRLTILEAKMYGERLDMDTSVCPAP